MQKKSNIKITTTERLLQYIRLKGITKYHFHKKVGLSNGFLDKQRAIGTDKCERILEQYPDINPVWLLTGSGSMLLQDEQRDQAEDKQGEEEEVVQKSVAIPHLAYQELTAQLHVKDQQIERKYDLFEGQLKTKDQQIERKDNQIETKDQHFNEKDRQIKFLEDQIKFQREEIKTLMDIVKGD